MATYRFSVHANLAPVEALFLWADLDRVTEWMDGVTRVTDVVGRPDRPDFTLPGRRLPLAISPESGYTLWFGRGPISRPVRVEVLWLAEPRPPAAYRTRLEGTFRRGEVLVSFEPDGGGSMVHVDVQTEGLLPGITGRLLAMGAYTGSFRGHLRSFARLAERERLNRLVL